MHLPENIVDNFELLNKSFRFCSFYTIGAGASAGLVPMTHELGQRIYERYYDYGVLSLNDSLLDIGAKRLLGPILSSTDPMTLEIVNRINPGAVRAIAMQLMAPALNQEKIPFQYIVFRLAKKGSVIFSFNVDNLAIVYCCNHLVLYPHGKLNPTIMQSSEWDEIIDICIQYNIEPLKIDDLLLPQHEPSGITENTQYMAGKSLFPYMKYLVFIGYSFGFDGNHVDDLETFEFFKDLIRSNPKPVIVIDPFRSIEISEMLKEGYKTIQVYAIPAYWEYLSKAKIILEERKYTFTNDKRISRQNLYYIYSELMDNMA